MKIEVLLKQLLGLVVISFLGVMHQSYMSEGFWIRLVTGLPFWISIFIFFKWRNWVTYEDRRLNGKK